MKAPDDYLTKLDEKAERIKLYCDNTLSNKFRMPVITDDETVRIIALSLFRASGTKKEDGVWLRGSLENLQDLHLELKVVYGKSNMKHSCETQKEHEVG